MYAINPSSTISASGGHLEMGGESLPFGIYSISADSKHILFSPAFPSVGPFIYIDSGVRRIPVAPEFYFIVGDKAGTVYRAVAATPAQVFSLPPASYGILTVVRVAA
jgi:hypothetical protein